MFEHIGRNLDHLLSREKISVLKLAHATGIPASTIKKIRSGGITNPTLATLVPIARFFSVTLEFLISEQQIETDSLASRPYFLSTWERAAEWPGAQTHTHYLQETQATSPVFGLQIDVDDYHPFLRGTVLLIDPCHPPSHRDYVIVTKRNKKRAALKLYLCDDENQYLQSLSIEEDRVSMTNEHQIKGVVTEYWKRLIPDANKVQLNN